MYPARRLAVVRARNITPNCTMSSDSKHTLRQLSAEEAAKLDPGEDHYRAYVGPPDQYDFMGATQFRLLTALGLRESHSLLDFGCGSLRSGKLFIPYLLPGRYFGLDPNAWLIQESIDRELGRDIIRLKQPTFRHDDDFRPTKFGTTFDFIVAQSIFSHTGSDLAEQLLSEFRSCLKPTGLALATFVLPHQMDPTDGNERGWIYPGCVAFEADTVLNFIAKAGLVGKQLSWFHPRQTWFAMAHSADNLPSSAEDAELVGDLREEVARRPGLIQRLKSAVARRIRA